MENRIKKRSLLDRGTVVLLWLVNLWVRRFAKKVIDKEKMTFVFIAHWVEQWNYLLDKKEFQYLHEDPILQSDLSTGDLQRCRRRAWRYRLNPFRVFDCVDSYQARTPAGEIRGHTLLVANCVDDFFWLKGLYALLVIRLRVAITILYAVHVYGAKVVGLGAATKDQRLANGGELYVRILGNMLPKDVSIVHGDTATASVIYEGVRDRLNGKSSAKILITGPTSKTGGPLVQALALAGHTVYMVSSSRSRCDAFIAEFFRKYPDAPGGLIHLLSIHDAPDDLDLVVTLKSVPAGEELVKFLGNTPVINGAVPDPLTAKIVEEYGINHRDGALVGFDRDSIDISFMMRLRRTEEWGIGYACWAGTILAAWRKLRGIEVNHEIGLPVLDEVAEVWPDMESLGLFRLAPATSFMVLLDNENGGH